MKKEKPTRKVPFNWTFKVKYSEPEPSLPVPGLKIDIDKDYLIIQFEPETIKVVVPPSVWLLQTLAPYLAVAANVAGVAGAAFVVGSFLGWAGAHTVLYFHPYNPPNIYGTAQQLQAIGMLGALNAVVVEVSQNTKPVQPATPPATQPIPPPVMLPDIPDTIQRPKQGQEPTTIVDELAKFIPSLRQPPQNYVSKPETETTSTTDTTISPNPGTPIKYMPPDDTRNLINMDLARRTSQAWNEFGTLQYEDAETGLKLLKETFKKYGLDIEKTEEGLKITEEDEENYDPLRIAAQLRARGIKDETLIQQAVNEGNGAVSQMEGFLQQLQSGLSTFDIEKYKPKQEDEAAIGPAGQAKNSGQENDSQKDEYKDFFDLLVKLFSENNPFVPADVRADLSVDSIAQLAPPDGTNISPGFGLSTEIVTALGLRFQASIVTHMVIADPDLTPGFHPDPLQLISLAQNRRA